ncbi:MAG: RidA family protein [Planctomycetota bacterium]
MTALDRRIVSTEDAPAAIGPYSQAVVAGGMVHCSGQISLDPATGQIVHEGDVKGQTERVLANMTAVLKAAGSSPDKAVFCTVFLSSMEDFAAVNELYGRWVNQEAPPARACVEVRRLPKDVLVEISCIALAD